MAEKCSLLMTCTYFKKYGKSHEIECINFIRQYCMGSKQDTCKRKLYRESRGIAPPEDMQPDGLMVVFRP